MIRQDPLRPGTYVVDVSKPMLEELTEGWSEPLQMRISDESLVMRVPEYYPAVDGACPACGGRLYLRYSRVWCRDKDCVRPEAAWQLLESYVIRRGV